MILHGKLGDSTYEIHKSDNYDNIESHDVVWNKCLTRVDTLKKENAADRVIHINRGRFNKVSHNVFFALEKNRTFRDM